MTEEPKTTCKSCAATILPVTATRFDGYCAPCYKELNAIPYVAPAQPPRSLISKCMDFAVPLFFITLFFLGIPLGYKLVLGGPLKTVTSGVIVKLHLAHPIPEANLEGRRARIVADYLIVDMYGGRKLWISEVNIAGVELKAEE